MALHKAAPLWSLGTQPLLLIAAYGRWSALPRVWNVDGLGYRPDVDDATLQAASVLHWTGKGKPWLDGEWRGGARGGQVACRQTVHKRTLMMGAASAAPYPRFPDAIATYRPYWRRYYTKACSGRGDCLPTGACKCALGYGGTTCEAV